MLQLKVGTAFSGRLSTLLYALVSDVRLQSPQNQIRRVIMHIFCDCSAICI